MNINYNKINCLYCWKELDVNDGDVLQILQDGIDILGVKCPFCKEENDVVIKDVNIILDIEIGE